MLFHRPILTVRLPKKAGPTSQVSALLRPYKYDRLYRVTEISKDGDHADSRRPHLLGHSGAGHGLYSYASRRCISGSLRPAERSGNPARWARGDCLAYTGRSKVPPPRLSPVTAAGERDGLLNLLGPLLLRQFFVDVLKEGNDHHPKQGSRSVHRA